MSEPSFEARMEKQMEAVRETLATVLAELREMRATLSPAPSRPSAGDVLSLEEAAEYIGVRPRTLRERQAGTQTIPRYSDRPVQFVRSSLDHFKRARVEREAALMRPPARPRGLIRRKPRAKD